jgi:hypothetical protein
MGITVEAQPPLYGLVAQMFDKSRPENLRRGGRAQESFVQIPVQPLVCRLRNIGATRLDRTGELNSHVRSVRSHQLLTPRAGQNRQS